MQLTSFNNWKVFNKIVGISVISIILLFAVSFGILLPFVERKMTDGKIVDLSNITDLVFQVTKEYDERAHKGEITLEEAQHQAKERIRTLRYANNEYFFIINSKSVMVMHPITPELEGKSSVTIKDPTGKVLFLEMASVTDKNGGGPVSYMWPKPDKTVPVPKLTYVRLYKPWGWIIGTGSYIDDISKEINKIRYGIIMTLLTCSVLIMVMSRVIAGRICRPLFTVIETSKRLARGDLTGTIEIRSSDETGQLMQAMQHMIVGLRGYQQSQNLLHEYQDRLALIIESSEDAIISKDMNGNISSWNKGAEKIFGYTFDEVKDRSITLIIPDDLRQEENRIQDKLKSSERIDNFETIRLTKDGQQINVSVTVSAIRDRHGSVVGASKIVRDITDRKRLEKELRISLELFSLFLKYSPIYIYIKEIKDKQSRVLQISDNFIDMVGRPAEELRGRTMYEIFSEDFARKITDDDLAVLSAGKFAQMDEELNGRNYTTLKFPIYRDESRFIAGFTIDVTDRKNAEKALYDTKAILQAAMDQSPAGIAIADASDGKLRYVNDAGLLIRGGDRQSIVNGASIDQYVSSWKILDLDGRQLRADEAPLARALKFGEVNHGEYVIRRDNNEDRIISANAAPIYDESGAVTAGIVVFTDVTERKRDEVQLKIISQRLHLATSAARHGIWDWNVRENAMIWDNRMFELYGITPTTFPSNIDAWTNGLHPDDRDAAIAQCQAALKGEEEFDTEFRVRHPDGSIRFLKANAQVIFDADGVAERMIGINADITEQKQATEERNKLEQQLQHAQKLESLGVLAGGIAHDFNNILQIIRGYCHMIKSDCDTTGEYASEIEKSVERAAELCRQMLVYAGKAPFRKVKVNLMMLVADMVKMLQSSIAQNVEIKINCPANIPAIDGDTSQLSQIVMNLIINAAEAIGEAKGHVIVSLEVAIITEGEVCKDYHGKPIPAGKYVRFVVTDNGCGMDDETSQKIFEPFFTTKFTGRGLGMSAVLGIISSHKGALQIFSQPGQGTIIKVYLSAAVSTANCKETIEMDGLSEPYQSTGTILLVEDEVQVRMLYRKMLERIGFTVIEASNGRVALEKYQQYAEDITLVITDLGMPEMDGYELFGELRRVAPTLPIVISSGFGDSAITTRIPREDIAGLISKPYKFDQLQELLKNVVSAQ